MTEIGIGKPPVSGTGEDPVFDFSGLKENGDITRIGELNPYVTLACDLRCKYCYMGDFLQTAKSTTELMSRGFLDSMVGALVDDGQGLERMTFLGGEPTLHPEITEMVNDAAKRDITQLRMTTNGVSLHYLDLARLTTGAFDHVSVSVDGVTAEDNDATRGRGAFKRIIETLKAYRAAEVPLSINYTVTKANIASLRQTPAYFQALGVVIVNYHRASLNGTAYDNPELIVGADEWIEARDSLLDHVESNSHDYAGMTFRIPYTFLTSQQMVEMGYKPIQAENYHSPDGGHRLIVLPPTPRGRGLCYMSSDLIGEPNAELGSINPDGRFSWNPHPRNELTAFRNSGSSAPNVSTLITGQESAGDNPAAALHRVSHSFKATITCE